MLTFCLAFILAVTTFGKVAAATYTGKVFSPDGKPVVGAKVIVLTNCTGPAGQPAIETDKFGRFTAEVKECPLDKNVASFVSAYVYAPDFVLNRMPLSKEEGNIFRLEYAGQVWGTVLDEKDKPVMGAAVELIDADRQDGTRISYSCSPFHDVFTTKTTADGRWTLSGVPPFGKASVLLRDRKYIQVWSNVLLGPDAGPAPPIIARPAAEVTGRVVYEGGKPAKDILVEALMELKGNSFAATDDNGAYRLYSLAGGVVDISAIDRSGKYIASGIKDVRVSEGRVTSVPDIVLSPGATIEGVVTDEATGKPRAGMHIRIAGSQGSRFSAGVARGVTDDKGYYSIRVAPGKNTVMVFNPDGYGRVEPNVSVTVGKGERKIVNIKLQPEVTVKGTVTGLDGRPLPDIPVNITVVVDEHGRSVGGRARTDGVGKFTIPNMVTGKAKFSIGDEHGVNEWEIMEPKKIQLPTHGLIHLKIRRTQFLTLAGRTLTPDGKPISGVTLQVKIGAPEEEGSIRTRRETLTTNTEGRFTIERIEPEETEIEVTAIKLGYVYTSGGKVVKESGKLAVSDIVMAPLTGMLKGQVVDSHGNPVAGAKVISPDGGLNERAETDSQGSFVLRSIPEGEIEVIAVHKLDVGRVRGRAGGEPLEVKLSTPRRVSDNDIELAYSILEGVWKESEGKQYSVRDYVPIELAPYDPDLVLKLARGSDGTVPDFVVAGTIATLAVLDPVRALKWSADKLEQIKDDHLYVYALSTLGLVLVDSYPERAAELYNRAKERASTDSHVNRVVDHSSLAALAAKLKNGDAQAMLDIALDLKDVQNVRERQWLRQVATEVVAKGSPEMAEQVASMLPPIERGGALSRASVAVSRYDPQAARRMLAEIEKQSDGEWAAAFIGSVSGYIINTMGKSDPVGVLAFARQQTNRRYRPRALMLAAGFQTKDVALQALQEAADVSLADYDATDHIASIAAQAFNIDEKVGRKLFELAKKTIESDRLERSNEASLAYYYARVDPAESRLMLDGYLGKLKQNPVRNYAWNETSAAIAMVALDVDRALELARSIPEDHQRYDALRKIAQYVLASDSARRNVDAHLWIGANTWRSEMPAWLGLRIWN